MTPKEFSERLQALFGEVTDLDLTFPEQAQFIGFAEYALFSWKLALAQAIATENEKKANTGDHFSA